MSYSDPEVYYYNGAAYCPDCCPDAPEEEIGVDAHLTRSETCGGCGAFGVFDGPYDATWAPAEDAQAVRWAQCACGTSQAYNRDTAPRLEALRGTLECPNCLGRLHF